MMFTYECNVIIGFIYRRYKVLALKIRKTSLNLFIRQWNVDFIVFEVERKRFNVTTNLFQHRMFPVFKNFYGETLIIIPHRNTIIKSISNMVSDFTNSKVLFSIFRPLRQDFTKTVILNNRQIISIKWKYNVCWSSMCQSFCRNWSFQWRKLRYYHRNTCCVSMFISCSIIQAKRVNIAKFQHPVGLLCRTKWSHLKI